MHPVISQILKSKRAMPLLSFPSVQLLGVPVGQLVTDSELQAEGMARIAAQYPSAAAVSMMDLSVEAEAFGAPIKFDDDEVPTVTGAIVSDLDEAEALAVPSLDAARLPVYIEAIRKAKARITDRPLLAGIIGPFSLAGRLLDMTEIMVLCYEEPEMVEAVLQKTAAFLTEYARALCAAGADGVVMAEPAAGLLSPALNREFSAPYVKQVIEAVHADGKVLVYHNCGNVAPLIDDICALGADVYHFGNSADLAALSQHIPEDVIFSGNIDPVGILCDATPEQTAAACDALKAAVGQLPNFIPSSGCDVPARASLANIGTFFGCFG